VCPYITPPENHATNEGNLVTSKSLASHIEKGPLWEENDDTVSLGSQTHKIEEQNRDIFDAIDSMSVDNTLFADNCKGDQSGRLQEIPQIKLCCRICYNSPPGDSSEN